MTAGCVEGFVLPDNPIAMLYNYRDRLTTSNRKEITDIKNINQMHVLTYGVESWILIAHTKQILQAFEMKKLNVEDLKEVLQGTIIIYRREEETRKA